MDSQIQREGVGEGAQCLERIVAAHKREQGRQCDIPGEKSGSEGHGNDHDGIDQLAEQRAEVISKLEMFALRDAFPEMVELNIAILGGNVGNHGGEHGARCSGINQLEQADLGLYNRAAG